MFLARIDDVGAKSRILAFQILVFYLLSRPDINKLKYFDRSVAKRFFFSINFYATQRLDSVVKYRAKKEHNIN